MPRQNGSSAQHAQHPSAWPQHRLVQHHSFVLLQVLMSKSFHWHMKLTAPCVQGRSPAC